MLWSRDSRPKDEKVVKSKWAARATVVLLLMEIKSTVQVTKHIKLIYQAVNVLRPELQLYSHQQ